MNRIKYIKVFGRYCFYIKDFKESSCIMMINSNDKLTSLELYMLYENIYVIKHSQDEEFLKHLDSILKEDISFACIAFTKDDKDHYLPIFTFTEDNEDFITTMINVKKTLRNTFSGAHLTPYGNYGN